MIYLKKQAHKQFKTTLNPTDYTVFCNLRSQCKALSKTCYQNFVREVQDSFMYDPNSFWKFIKSKKKDSGLPAIMQFQDSISEDGNVIVNYFASYFSSVYSPHNTHLSPSEQLDNNSSVIHSFSITESEVIEKISSMRHTSPVGPDEVPLSLIKGCALSLSTPLTIIFNLSLTQGKFPDFWKSSFISLIFKSGDKGNIINYRPVAILSVIPKIFESLVNDRIYNSVKSYITSDQHGFLRQRSTITNLLVFVEHVFKAFESRSQVDVVFTDFSKAFDKVNHRILLSKLQLFGICPNLLSWFSTYLCGRTHNVRYKNFISEPILATSGVPQGSHLGPLLFNIFINDLTLSIKYSKCLLYADDLKLMKVISREYDSVLLQEDLHLLSEWCESNLMDLNLAKCKIMTFHRSKDPIISIYLLSNVRLLRVFFVNDLGVALDQGLSFKPHIANISSKALKMLGFIIRNSADFNLESIERLYFSFVRSVVEYGSIVWSPYFQSYSDRIERIQNKFLRFAAFKLGISLDFETYSATRIRNMLNLEPLAIRRKKADVLFIFKLINYVIDSPNLLAEVSIHVPPRPTRNTPTFSLPRSRTKYLQNAPIQRMLQTSNDSSLDFFHSSLCSFRSAIRRLQL